MISHWRYDGNGDATRRVADILFRAVQFRLNKASYTSLPSRIFPRREALELNALNAHLMVPEMR